MSTNFNTTEIIYIIHLICSLYWWITLWCVPEVAQWEFLIRPNNFHNLNNTYSIRYAEGKKTWNINYSIRVIIVLYIDIYRKRARVLCYTVSCIIQKKRAPGATRLPFHNTHRLYEGQRYVDWTAYLREIYTKK